MEKIYVFWWNGQVPRCIVTVPEHEEIVASPRNGLVVHVKEDGTVKARDWWRRDFRGKPMPVQTYGYLPEIDEAEVIQ